MSILQSIRGPIQKLKQNKGKQSSRGRKTKRYQQKIPKRTELPGSPQKTTVALTLPSDLTFNFVALGDWWFHVDS